MLLLSFLQICITFALAVASAIPSPRPLVVWHGLGDSYASPGMLEFVSLVKDIHPGIFVHLVYIDKNDGLDRRAGFYGEVNGQVELVAQQLSSIPELQYGFDGIGFSQGGQFLRAYVERYNNPPVHNLITFGSQHMGISDIPGCALYDFLCQVARKTAVSAVYSSWAQSNLIQAQYYRDPNRYETYLQTNHFLADINNEVQERRNVTYARNLALLENLVLVLFTEDKTVIPKESAWFGSEEIPRDSKLFHGISEGQQVLSTKKIIPMREQPLYVEDWIGLRQLDERGGIVFKKCIGEHMVISKCWKELVRLYTGTPL